MSPKRRSSSPSSSAAPGQYYGYAIQAVRAVTFLLRAHAGTHVAIEDLDDVTYISEDGVVLEQDKSSFSNNPLSDRSVQLWKALGNWIELIKNGALKKEARFVLYTAQKWEGDIASRIHKASNHAHAMEVLDHIRRLFFSQDVKEPPSKSISKYVAALLDCDPPSTVCELICNITIENDSSTPLEELESQLKNHPLPDSSMQDVITGLLGWANAQLLKKIEKQCPGLISRDEFHNYYVKLARKHLDNSALTSYPPPEVPPTTIDEHLSGRIYIKQLQAIEVPPDGMTQAVIDFLHANILRTKWSAGGELGETEFELFEQELKRIWENLRHLIPLEHSGQPEESIGRMLWLRCTQQQCQIGTTRAGHEFVSGSLHAMADESVIGWHPKYKAFLAQLDSTLEL